MFLQEGYNWEIQATSASENWVILNRLHIVVCKRTATFVSVAYRTIDLALTQKASLVLLQLFSIY